MKLTNNLGLPMPFVRAVEYDPTDRGPTGAKDVSVTTLVDSPRIKTLTTRNQELLTDDVSNRVWTILGSCVHTLLERYAGPGSPGSNLAEKRVSTFVDGWHVHGQPDLLEGNGTLSDWKFAGIASVYDGPKETWKHQVQVYAYLLKKNNFKVDRAQIVVIYRDWVASRAGQDGYPPSAVGIFPIPLWADQEVEKYIKERLALFGQARDAKSEAEMPMCTAEERWEKPTTFAVKASGAKKALRVLDTKEEAASWILANPSDKKMSVEERPGENTRCLRFCAVAKCCGFGKKQLAEAEAKGHKYA